MNKVWMVVVVLLAGCPELEQLQAHEADAGEPALRVPQEAAQADAGAPEEPEADAGHPQELDATLEPDSGALADAGEPHPVDYDFEGTWEVTSTPNADQMTTCQAGVQLPSITQTWIVTFEDGELVVRRKGTSDLTGTLKIPGTYELTDTDNRGLPVAGAIHWTVTLDEAGFHGPAWLWVDELGCGGSFDVVGVVL